MSKKIELIKEKDIEKETKKGKVCLHYSRALGGIFVPDNAREEILKGAKFCIFE